MEKNTINYLPHFFMGICMFAGCGDDTIEHSKIEGNDPGECMDDADNDQDGLFDCNDPDCTDNVECTIGPGDSSIDTNPPTGNDTGTGDIGGTGIDVGTNDSTDSGSSEGPSSDVVVDTGSSQNTESSNGSDSSGSDSVHTGDNVSTGIETGTPQDQPTDNTPEDTGNSDNPNTGAPDATDTGANPPTDTEVDLPSDTEDVDVVPDGPSSQRLTEWPLGSTTSPLGYVEYLPPGYGIGKFPLLVHLHGLGENGNGTTDLYMMTIAGPPRLIAENNWPSDRPFIVLAPQHSGNDCPGAEEIKLFFDYALANYDVDMARVYLTGLSCGGEGAWHYVGDYLDSQVVALVSIAGDGRAAWDKNGCDITRVAIWAFHGALDDVNPPEWTTVPMENILACPGVDTDRMKMTIYPNVDHFSWEQTYDMSAGHDIYTWMLGISRQ